jgi:hypothetical protein
VPTDFFDGKFCPAMRDWNLSSVGEKKADKTNPDDFRSLEFRSVESRGPSDSRCWTKFGFDWRVPPGSAGVPPADARSADARLHNPTRRRDVSLRFEASARQAGAPRSRVKLPTSSCIAGLRWTGRHAALSLTGCRETQIGFPSPPQDGRPKLRCSLTRIVVTKAD